MTFPPKYWFRSNFSNFIMAPRRSRRTKSPAFRILLKHQNNALVYAGFFIEGIYIQIETTEYRSIMKGKSRSHKKSNCGALKINFSIDNAFTIYG